ncbi:hypothetical protein M3210_04350 [Oceanobacillus luteolus]|uniref:Uncharacterized protein n=1 Tax=Oceanobacillus luteolus TaxID=1274358 RepID=A0ABW4HL92_9BACI|nr:hypothetical protein [Oceanobacillus luteolus]MCM3739495.1 hypothetical protein [Oceanobacillus luteolus]
MKLYQVRKGQFVFYKNELHKVYSVKPMFKQSVHLYRLKDMEQILTKASEIELYKPKHNDTFIFYGKRYTIDQYTKPEPGDYILITKPAPDLLDHYSLNEIEKVESVDDVSVTTTRDNGVKHHEYVVMVPGKNDASQEIAYYDKDLVPEEQRLKDESISYLAEKDKMLQPYVGDVYLDKRKNTRAMVIAVSESEVILGHGVHVHVAELLNEDSFELVYRYSGD